FVDTVKGVHYNRRMVTFDHGALLHWEFTDDPGAMLGMNVEVHYTGHVAFRDLGPPSRRRPVTAVEVLANLVEFVRDRVVQRFARRCFGGELDFGPTISWE